MNQLLPPGAEFFQGQIVRRVAKVEEDGSEWTQIRPVAHSLEEARANGWDYFSPQVGWIRNGRKTEKDHFLQVEAPLSPFMASQAAEPTSEEG